MKILPFLCLLIISLFSVSQGQIIGLDQAPGTDSKKPKKEIQLEDIKIDRTGDLSIYTGIVLGNKVLEDNYRSESRNTEFKKGIPFALGADYHVHPMASVGIQWLRGTAKLEDEIFDQTYEAKFRFSYISVRGQFNLTTVSPSIIPYAGLNLGVIGAKVNLISEFEEDSYSSDKEFKAALFAGASYQHESGLGAFVELRTGVLQVASLGVTYQLNL